MQIPHIPQNEAERLEALWQMKILDTAPEDRFDKITKEAAEKLGAPISMISIIDKDREWYKSCVGLDIKEQPREISFCAHAMLSREIFIIEDAKKDPRFADNPQVIGYPYVRAYAGITLHDKKTGFPIRVLCVKDNKPRSFSSTDISSLIELGAKAEDELNRR